MTYPNKVSTVEWELVPCLLQDEYECGTRLCQHLAMIWMDTNVLENVSDFLDTVRIFDNN